MLRKVASALCAPRGVQGGSSALSAGLPRTYMLGTGKLSSSDRDLVFIRDMKFVVKHGVYAEERVAKQPFVVSVEVKRAPQYVALEDDLTKTIDYSKVYKVVQKVMTGPSVNLIETLAQDIATQINAEWRSELITVEIQKPKAKISGKSGTIGTMGVKIIRKATEE